MSGFVPPPPLHTYELPPVAVKLIEGVVQVKVVVPVLLVMPAVGGTTVPVMVVVAVAVQPLAPVTVTA